MVMLSTSVLRIRRTIRGKPKSIITAIGRDFPIHSERDQRSGSVSIISAAQAFFWASRSLFATVETGKDLPKSVKNLG